MFFLAFLTACHIGQGGIPLTQLSTGSDSAFTERQSKDLSELLKKLHQYAFHNESCSQIRDALDSNATLNSLEQAYNLKPYFIYDELVQFINVASVLNSPQTTEESVMQNVLALWKTEARVEQIQAIIVKIRKCYPQFA